MTRSVATPRNAHTVLYLAPDLSDATDAYSYFVRDIEDLLIDAFPSLTRPYRPYFIDRDCPVLLQNLHAAVTLTQEGPVSALALIPIANSDLAIHWCDQVKARLRSVVHNAYPDALITPMSRASSGEVAYRLLPRPQESLT
jgi:hypothetical protein